MKKIFVLMTVIIGVSAGMAYGQESSDIYIYGTSTTGSVFKNGLNRLSDKRDADDRSPRISFVIRTPEYEIWLTHYNRKNRVMQIVDLPIYRLDTFYVMSVKRFLLDHTTKGAAMKWAATNFKKGLDGQKIWIIDSKDDYKSYPSLSSPDMMRMIEVEISITNFTSEPDLELEE